MPGGVVNNPPQNIQSAVQRTVPKFPIEHFNRIASMYFTEYHHEAESPGAVRQKMDAIGRKASALWIELGNLSEESKDTLFAGSMKMGIADIESFSKSLRDLMMATRHAENSLQDVAKGRGRGALAALVSRLAGVMEGIGMALDAKPRGDLVYLIESALDAYGHETGPALKAAQRHLDKIRSNLH